jgi:hypothetical protein
MRIQDGWLTGFHAADIFAASHAGSFRTFSSPAAFLGNSARQEGAAFRFSPPGSESENLHD